jgi:hypothetical protein
MKLLKSQTLSAFGGMNFVFDFNKKSELNTLIESIFPELSSNSKYSWSDFFNTLISLYLCGGEYIEDIQSHLKNHFQDNPYMKMPSSDTMLRRMSELSVDNRSCVTKRGSVTHTYNYNEKLNLLNLLYLKSQNVFNSGDVVLDYDNTIIFNEKSDSKMTYKRNPGYQPGVCTVNEEHILFVENRNGNSDAKSFQDETFGRLFTLLKSNGIDKIHHFRADAASYQYDIVNSLEQEVDNFYIGCRNSYVDKYFTVPEKWEEIKDSTGEKIEIGEVIIIPFQKQAQDNGVEAKKYRLIIKRKKKESQQLDLFTQDAYEYRAILTNNFDMPAIEVAQFYNRRGNMERQFDIVKNDFGWNHMPFSTLEKNSVFLCLTAFCRNLYSTIIHQFSKLIKGLKSTDRVKKFLFNFVILPSKWINRARQNYLRIFSSSKKYILYEKAIK